MTVPESAAVRGNDQLRRLSVLIATSFIDMMGLLMVVPLLPFRGLALHATPQLIGLMTASYSIAQLLSSPIWGRVSDRYGRRPALLIGLIASALAYLVFGLAQSLWLLFLSRIIQGAGGGTTGVIQAYVADTVPPGDRARALGWLSAATSLGVILGPLIGSGAAHLGPSAPGLIAATLCGLNIAFAWKWLPESRQLAPPGEVKVRKPVWHAALAVVQHPTRMVSRFILIYGAGMLGFTGLTFILPLYLGREFGINEKTIFWVFMYFGTLGFLMRAVLLGPIVARIGEAAAMRTGTILMMFGLFLYPQTHNIPLLAVIMSLVPIGTALLFPATTSLMSQVTEKSELGTTLGVAQMFAGVARIIAPLIAASAFQYVSTAAPFYVAGAIVAFVGLLAFRVTPGAMSAPVEEKAA